MSHYLDVTNLRLNFVFIDTA